MANGDSGLPQWINLLYAILAGAVVANVAFFRWLIGLNSRIQKIETLDIRSIIRDELAKERHDNLYPMLQVRVYAEIDKLEEELKKQGQNISILLERDRILGAMDRMAEAIQKSLNTGRDRPYNP